MRLSSSSWPNTLSFKYLSSPTTEISLLPCGNSILGVSITVCVFASATFLFKPTSVTWPFWTVIVVTPSLDSLSLYCLRFLRYFSNFSLASLASLTPVIAYVGLTNIISNLSTKTAFEQY